MRVIVLGHELYYQSAFKATFDVLAAPPYNASAGDGIAEDAHGLMLVRRNPRDPEDMSMRPIREPQLAAQIRRYFGPRLGAV